MGKETGISWTDHTFNPWWGCTKVSPGCDHCYAETFDKRVGGSHWGKGAARRTFGDAHWNEPLRWNQDAFNAGASRKVFCASMADVMDDEAPAGARERLWDLIDRTAYLTWQLLTKRPQRYGRYLPAKFRYDNVWLGTSAEDQNNYNLRWPILRRACEDRNAVSWISYEPALGPLHLRSTVVIDNHYTVPDWVICGGESGAGRRPMLRRWAEDLHRECKITGTAFFMKQMSAQTPSKGAALIPAHLLMREFPNLAERVSR